MVVLHVYTVYRYIYTYMHDGGEKKHNHEHIEHHPTIYLQNN
jgi:hypothetical protein